MRQAGYAVLQVDPPAQLDQLEPTELSFWITSLFESSIVEQQVGLAAPQHQLPTLGSPDIAMTPAAAVQALLEMASTLSRLKALQQVLEENLKVLRAKKALKGVFEPEPEAAAAAEVQQPSPDSGATASAKSDTQAGPAASGPARPDLGQAGGEQQPDGNSSGNDMPSGAD